MMDEKKTVALILAQLAEGEGIAVGIEPDEEGEVELSPEEQLRAVAGELVEATRCGDVAAVAEALRGAFLLLDSMPHVEGSHLEEQEEQEEEEEPEESADPYETVSHELRERFGGHKEEEEEGHAFGGRAARRRYAAGGKVRRYADGGMVPGGSPDLEALTSRARATLGAATMQRAGGAPGSTMPRAGGMPASPGVVTSGPSTMDSRAALARALSRR